MIRFGEFILDIIYPRKCAICHKILENPKMKVCRSCFLKLVFVSGNYCMKCGKPVSEEQEYCEQCKRGEMIFTQGRSVLVYNEIMKKSILKFKYENHRTYGDFYAGLMCEFFRKQILQWQPDIILPVPLHKRKLRMRGFNQSEYLAVRIGRVFGIPVPLSVLRKVRNTRSQKTLDAEKRRKNLENAFCVCEDVRGLKILVIDDVFTTGSTMNEISAVLMRKGAKKVFFLTICTGYN